MIVYISFKYYYKHRWHKLYIIIFSSSKLNKFSFLTMWCNVIVVSMEIEFKFNVYIFILVLIWFKQRGEIFCYFLGFFFVSMFLFCCCCFCLLLVGINFPPQFKDLFCFSIFQQKNIVILFGIFSFFYIVQGFILKAIFI